MGDKQVTIIIQARSGSTRLPGKMTMPFFEGKSILEIIIGDLMTNCDYKIVLATTDSSKDNELVTLAHKTGVDVFRGSEDDVLRRFISAAEAHNANHIIRVCGDNPFLSIFLMKELFKIYDGEDYLSFRYDNGKPTILGHLGMFCEFTNISALQKAAELTSDKLYREHVTNFLYGNPDVFNVKLVDLPETVQNYEGIRLTVDTKNDFDNSAKLYAQFGSMIEEDDIQKLIDYIQLNTVLLQSMQGEIKMNTK